MSQCCKSCSINFKLKLIFQVHVTVYKPILTEVFTVSKLSSVLEALFQQETVSILNYKQDWITLFFKGGFYFMFDPHARNIEGRLRINTLMEILFRNTLYFREFIKE